MKKWLLLVFSFYVAMLTVLPCRDAHFFAAASAHEAPVSFTAAEPHEAHASTDACSPLCACTCCNLSLPEIKETAPQLPVVCSFVREQTALCPDEGTYSCYEGSIWIPPKITV